MAERPAGGLAAIALAMFGFSYTMIPFEFSASQQARNKVMALSLSIFDITDKTVTQNSK